jgi:hypothetical protein
LSGRTAFDVVGDHDPKHILKTVIQSVQTRTAGEATAASRWVSKGLVLDLVVDHPVVEENRQIPVEFTYVNQ